MNQNNNQHSPELQKIINHKLNFVAKWGILLIMLTFVIFALVSKIIKLPNTITLDTRVILAKNSENNKLPKRYFINVEVISKNENDINISVNQKAIFQVDEQESEIVIGKIASVRRGSDQRLKLLIIEINNPKGLDKLNELSILQLKIIVSQTSIFGNFYKRLSKTGL